MKKQREFNRRSELLHKLLRIMKLSSFLMVVFALSVSASSYSQSTKLNLRVKNGSLVEVLKLIEDQSEFYFYYNNDEIKGLNDVSINTVNKQVQEVLDELLDNTSLEYKMIDRYIVVKRKDGSAFDYKTMQLQKVSGKITDSYGSTLPGVTVVVKGTTNGIITDADGFYSLNNVPADGILVFSFVGMKTQEIQCAGQVVINIVMEEETIGLEEVVAIGYGTMKKSDLTGSVTSVNMDGSELAANTNVMQALQGSAAGINVGAVTSAGESPSFSIRGQTTLSADQSPLIVLDGIIFNGSLSDLNVSDIERIDILKDASAAAVYGSRSANGVVLVTTKKGKLGKPLFNLNVYHGIQEVSNKVNMANGDKYVQKLLDWRDASGLDTDPANIEQYLQPLEVENYRNNSYVDWIDLVTRTAPISQYELSISGQNENTNYYLSGSYTEQEGVVEGDKFSRTTLKANFSNDITAWMTIGLRTLYAHKDYSGEQANLEMAVWASPLATVYANKETKELNLYPQTDQLVINPLSYMNAEDEEVYDDLYTTFYTDIQIPKVKGLKFHFDYSKTLSFGKHNQFWGANTVSGLLAPNGKASKHNTEERAWSVNNILSYSRDIRDRHHIEVTMLYSSEERKGETSEMNASNFFTSSLGWNNIGLGEVQSNNSEAWKESSTGLMGRIMYGFDQKYLVTATFRRDGFSGFSESNKYANFPSLSFGWVASEEGYFEDINWLSFLKFRLSYGVNGNQALGRYGSMAQIEQVPYVFGDGGGTAIGTYPSTLGNTDLGWEKTKSINLGINMNVLDNRISGEFDIYKTKTTDLLVQQSLPEISGYSNVWTNLGEIQNKGFEITLNTVNITSPKIRWESRFSFSLNRNEIKHLYGEDNNDDGIEDDDIGNEWFIGKSLGAYYDYKTNGIYQLNDTDIPSGFYPGYFKMQDTDGIDGITPDDRTIVGYSTPNYQFSIYNELSYKNFSLSFLINSVQGGGDGNYYIGENSPGLNPNYSFPDRLNIPDIDYWTSDNPSNSTPIINYKSKYFHGMYQDRSFVRLQDVTLAYTMKTNRLLGLRSLRMYLSGKNLYTWTDWTGWDPEAGTTAGGDYYQYSAGGKTGNPVMRSFIFGINLSF